jgi:cytoskeletal protein CcmA (bactofilin family)
MSASVSNHVANPVVSGELTAVIEAGVRFEGIVTYSGTMHVNGTLIGKVITPDVLVVGETGRVRGDIQAGVVIIHGEVEATIKATYRVEMKRPAVFKGEMSTPSLLVEDGVLFEGTNKMIQRG